MARLSDFLSNFKAILYEAISRSSLITSAVHIARIEYENSTRGEHFKSARIRRLSCSTRDSKRSFRLVPSRRFVDRTEALDATMSALLLTATFLRWLPAVPMAPGRPLSDPAAHLTLPPSEPNTNTTTHAVHLDLSNFNYEF